jgi:hypothetical protein
MPSSSRINDTVFSRYLTDFVEGTVADPELLEALKAHHRSSKPARRMVEEARRLNSAMQEALAPLAPSRHFDAAVMEKVQMTSSLISKPTLAAREKHTAAAEDERTVPIQEIGRGFAGVIVQLWPLAALAVALVAVTAALVSSAGQPLADCGTRPPGARIEAYSRGRWQEVDRSAVYSGDRVYAPGKGEWKLSLPGEGDEPAATLTLGSGAVHFEKRGRDTVLYPMRSESPLTVSAPGERPLAIRIEKVTVDRIQGTTTVRYSRAGAVTVTVLKGKARVTTEGFDSIWPPAGDTAVAEQDKKPCRAAP